MRNAGRIIRAGVDGESVTSAEPTYPELHLSQ